MSIIKVFIITCFAPIFSSACKISNTIRNYEVDRLIDITENIVVVKVSSMAMSRNNFFNDKKYDYKMDVVRVLKGNKIQKTILLNEFDAPKKEVVEIGVGVDCINHGGFAKNTEYLVFVNSINIKAYKKISGKYDKWLLQVESKIKNKK